MHGESSEYQWVVFTVVSLLWLELGKSHIEGNLKHSLTQK